MSKEPLFRKLSEKKCIEMYGFSKEEMECLYNDGKGLFSDIHKLDALAVEGEQ